ncbi:MAG TPA: acyl-CoA dehydrogenase, partial [Desulfotomaculum sp.]|nr:acyl-CoA dehydrogenase [Desulfotomaculum sp.]
LVPAWFFTKMGEQGYLAPWIDEKYGGSGVGFEYSGIILNEISKLDVGLGTIICVHSDIVPAYVASYGTEEQKEKWLPGAANGELVYAVAMTEPNAGSDLQAITSTAVKKGDTYVINGTKTFITNGMNAGIIVVAAKTDTKAVPPFKGISLFVVEDGTPGFVKSRKLDKVGIHNNDTAELVFEDCVIPASNIIGEEGKGFYYMMQKLQQERLVCAMVAQGGAERILEETVNFAKSRKAFGVSIGNLQHNLFKLAEMATEVELGRTFLEDLLADHISGKDVVTKVSMAKYWISEMVNHIAYHGLQIHGGYGYMEEYPIARFFRDVRSLTIVAGTTEVMKLIVGRNLLRD